MTGAASHEAVAAKAAAGVSRAAAKGRVVVSVDEVNRMLKTAGADSPGKVVPVEDVNRMLKAETSAKAPAFLKATEAQDEAVRSGFRQTLGDLRQGTRTSERLSSWLARSGGLQDASGELKAMDARFKVGLVNRKGRNLDDAARAAWEEGFFPEYQDRPSIRDFLDALRDDLTGTAPRIRLEDGALDEQAAAADALARELDAAGIDWRTLTDDEVEARWQDWTAEQGARLNAEAPVPETARPVTLDDLEDIGAQADAARWQEDLAAPGRGMAGNVNLAKVSGPDDIRNAIASTARLFSERLDDARRGRVSQAETARLARSLGMTPERLLKRRKGQAFNAEEALAARNILARSAEDLAALSRKAVGGSDADVAAFQEALTRHVAIQEQVAGMTAEAGRALAQFRQMAKASEAQRARAIKQMIERHGGRDRVEDLARMVSTLDDPAQVAKFTREAHKATAWDMIAEAWINALLSGPQTHATNILSNVLTALWTLPENALAATLGTLRKTDKVRYREIGRRLFGMVQGAREGLYLGGKAFWTEEASDLAGKIEARRYQAIPGKLGKLVRIPGRMLLGEDEFFKAVGRRMELGSLAVRKAADEGLTGAAYKRRVADLLANPTDDMMDAAVQASEYLTFTKDLGEHGKALQRLARHPAARFVVPFVRTPINIVKFAAERSPFGLLMKDVRADLLGKNGKVARDLAAARMMMGTGLGAYVASLASEGHITGGGPSDPRERAALYQTGWQPYSVKVGDQWVSYGRLEPLGMLVGVAADYAEIRAAMSDEEADKVAAMITGAISKNLVSKTWLSGLSDLLQAIEDPDRYGERYVQRQVGTVIPTGVAQVARTADPVLRDVRTMLDAIKARVPGQRETLFPRRDLWGEPIRYGGSVGPDLLSPVYVSKDAKDPAAKEIVRLDIRPSRLARRINGVELTPEQYDRYQVLAGQASKTILHRLVRSPKYARLPDFMKANLIGNLLNRTRAMARQRMLTEYPEIARAAADAEVEALGVR